ncbi:hypothetical protein [Streptomyces sp. ME19-01-6]|uniref:hypothetical protein n=1 Tax=Streptomyces sp. ME19-01-6 TaxID=3028686 RepID=UPI0029A46D09|nr:hypothetical protein [Streptomyces sp. ME19-01-6]MDX3230603.1 hypothetical protein [Streptomyces sp. ME19-01-6]
MVDDTPECLPLPGDLACEVDVCLLDERDDAFTVSQGYLHERERPADMSSNQAPGLLSNLADTLLDTVDTSAAAVDGDVHCAAPKRPDCGSVVWERWIRNPSPESTSGSRLVPSWPQAAQVFR